MKKVGFTTSIPVEVLFVADVTPVDLNNIFISSSSPSIHVECAERDGFPRNTCAWIKGIYSSVMKSPDIDTIISVVEGDCSNTRALSEVLETKGISCIPFSYPVARNYDILSHEIHKLCSYFDVRLADVVQFKKVLDDVRCLTVELDEMTWREGFVTGFENHLWQVSCSDFNGNYEKFEKQLTSFIEEARERRPTFPDVRLGYVGVPPISPDLYDYIEELGGRVIYNEVQRQFTMVGGLGIEDIVETYRRFTYPYTLKGRIFDIRDQIEQRGLHGIIHYTQAFCFRGIEDIILRKELGVPVLTLEGDKPGKLDARTKLRIEAFVDMLKGRM